MDLLFRDRTDAGNRLANDLAQHRTPDTIIFAIPRGGAPVAAAAARRLELPWRLVPVRKLPIPWNPEAGFGAVAIDRSVVLNEGMVRGMRMRREQIDEVVERAVAELTHTYEALSNAQPAPDVTGKRVIVVDDGLASGYTMLAAVQSLRTQGADMIVAAAPVASKSASDLVHAAADACVFQAVSSSIPFAVADYYLQWRDLTDQEVIDCFQLC